VKICVIGIPGIPPGKRNVKDPRLDQAHQLVEAKKKTCAQVDVVGEANALEADAILVERDRLHDLLLKDLELVETRLGREPDAAEAAVLLKLEKALTEEIAMSDLDLSEAERQAVAAHSFHTNKPVVVTEPLETDNPDALVLRTFQQSGHICYLTVGGLENRAWPIRNGATAWEAAAAIHSDIQRGFIRAEVISFSDFLEAGGETEAKRAGSLRLELKNYVVQDYDLVNFRFSN
jgi:ribosome-binding ATPase YchF (GTP1/OBG family)